MNLRKHNRFRFPKHAVRETLIQPIRQIPESKSKIQLHRDLRGDTEATEKCSCLLRAALEVRIIVKDSAKLLSAKGHRERRAGMKPEKRKLPSVSEAFTHTQIKVCWRW
jgi:hypothetical protein